MTNDENCVCTHNLQEKVKSMETKSSLSKVKGTGYGKDFWMNIEGERAYCFDCMAANN